MAVFCFLFAVDLSGVWGFCGAKIENMCLQQICVVLVISVWLWWPLWVAVWDHGVSWGGWTLLFGKCKMGPFGRKNLICLFSNIWSFLVKSGWLWWPAE
jgi:hypothetical protein